MSLFSSSVMGRSWPVRRGDHHVGVVDGVPNPVDAGHRGHHDHVRRSNKAEVAEWRRRSISSLMALSFSMKVSVWGM